VGLQVIQGITEGEIQESKQCMRRLEKKEEIGRRRFIRDRQRLMVKDDDEDGISELDLDDEAELESKCFTIAIFYSQKSYNPQFLFSDMLKAWGISNLAVVEKIGDYCFKLEFMKREKLEL
jgi:hypothetical protein